MTFLNNQSTNILQHGKNYGEELSQDNFELYQKYLGIIHCTKIILLVLMEPLKIKIFLC